MASRFLFLPGNEQSSNRVNRFQISQGQKVLNFSTFDEDSYTWGFLGADNVSGSANVVITYFMENITSGSVVWSASVAHVTYASQTSEANIFNDDYYTVSSVSSEAGQLTKATITLPSVQINDGDYFKIQIKRLCNNLQDTAFGDAQLLAVELKTQ